MYIDTLAAIDLCHLYGPWFPFFVWFGLVDLQETGLDLSIHPSIHPLSHLESEKPSPKTAPGTVPGESTWTVPWWPSRGPAGRQGTERPGVQQWSA